MYAAAPVFGTHFICCCIEALNSSKESFRSPLASEDVIISWMVLLSALYPCCLSAVCSSVASMLPLLSLSISAKSVFRLSSSSLPPNALRACAGQTGA